MIVVVGEDRGTGGGATRRALARLADVPLDELLEAVVWVNLWDVPGVPARNLVRLVEQATRPGDAVVMLGRRVAAEFLLEDLRPLERVVRSGGEGPVLLALPHPSGRNRWYNDKANRAAAAAEVRAIWGGYSR